MPTGYAQCYDFRVSFTEIKQEAKALTARQRTALVSELLKTLPLPAHAVTNEEVAEQERELDSGRVQEISHQEFIRRITFSTFQT